MRRTTSLTALFGLSAVALSNSVVAASASGLTEVSLRKHNETRRVGSISNSIDVSINTASTDEAKASKPTDKTHAFDFAPDYANAPLVVTVDLDRQYLTAYKGLDVAFQSRISSGKSGHTTPTGIFSILEKKKYHESNLYSNAPMPYMQRLTWSGIALHQGRVPPYPASHGCVRIPKGNAKKLFGKTSYRTHVIITRGDVKPVPISHWKLPQPDAMVATLASLRPIITDTQNSKSKPTKAEKKEPLRIYITRTSRRDRQKALQEMLIELGYLEGVADGIYGRQTIASVKAFQRSEMLTVTGTASEETIDRLLELTSRPALPTGMLYVRQKHEPIFKAPVAIDDLEKPLGTHLAYVADMNDERADWLSMAVPTRLKSSTIKDHDIDPTWRKQRVRVSMRSALERIEIPDHAREFLSENLVPGTSLAISDNGLGSETGKGTDFIVQTY